LIYLYFLAEDGIRARNVTEVQTCALPISFRWSSGRSSSPRTPGLFFLAGCFWCLYTACCAWPLAGIGLHSSFSVSCALALAPQPDRKSTRLNSSHVSISYAVFCLKKKIAQ